MVGTVGNFSARADSLHPDILVKAYFPGTSAFKPGGTLSNYLDVMVEGKMARNAFGADAESILGEDIDIKGPTGEITYLGNGDFTVNDDKFHFDKVSGCQSGRCQSLTVRLS